MNLVDFLALATQSAHTLSVVLEVINKMNSEGRTQATDEEKACVRQLALDSDARLSQAIARG